MIITSSIIKTKPTPNISLARSKNFKNTQKYYPSKAINLNFTAQCQKPDINHTIKQLKEVLEEFEKEYGKVKSSTYISKKIEQVKKDASNETLSELNKLRAEYYTKIRWQRSYMARQGLKTEKDYTRKLKKYIKENGAYINCGECTLLLEDILEKRGIEFKRIDFYARNEKGYIISSAEHVFNIVGMAQNAQIRNPDTWGDNAVICDAWAGIVLPYKDAIAFYGDFFNINPSVNSLYFQLASPIVA